MNSDPERKEAALALQRLASCVRDLMPRFVNLQLDGSGSPHMLALRDTFTAFPAPAEVLFIDGTGRPDRRNGNAVRTLIRFDMTQPRTCAVRFAASVAAADLADHRDMLEEHFGIEGSLWEPICDFSLLACWRDFNYTFLAPYDIRTEPEKCAIEFAHRISMDSNFKEMFLSEPDFNAKYRLQPDPVLSAEELLRIDFRTAMPTSHVLRQFTLQELQENVADIQPIPQVPESVREVIRRAKKLYVYGFFEYAFFTVAAHYAYAAMEAALKARWGTSLERPVKLRFHDEQAVLDRTGYAGIEDYCESRKWKARKVSVNGKPFPWNSDLLLEWLIQEKVICEWQRAMFKKAYLPLRNSHSHLEHCSTWMPDEGTLRSAMEQINILFDSVPVLQTEAGGVAK